MTYDELLSLITGHGVHPALGDTGQGWGIEQNAHELATFLVAMQELGVQKVLEIGTGHRMGLARFLANDLGWRVVTLDRDQPANHYPNVEYLMGSSAILRPLFDGAQFDLVILDGDNTYEGVVRDYDMYAPLATKAVAVCKIGGHRGCEGVARFWHEIELQVRTVHVLAEGDGASGIGWYPVREEALPEPQTIEQEYPVAIEDEDQVAALEESGMADWVALEPTGELRTFREIAADNDDLDTLVHEPVIVEEDDLPPAPKKKPVKRKTTTKRTKKTA